MLTIDSLSLNPLTTSKSERSPVAAACGHRQPWLMVCMISLAVVLSMMMPTALTQSASAADVKTNRNANATTVRLATAGKAQLPVVVSANTDERVTTAAKTLASYLGQMAGTTFEVQSLSADQIVSRSTTKSIRVGVAADFPALNLSDRFDPADALRREEYLLQTSNDGMVLIGATPLAVEHAVWDTLRRLGYRQFFPGKTWEVIPTSPTLELAVDTFEVPDFKTRWIWYGFGMSDYNKEPYAQWNARNRAVPGFQLATAHSYQYIIRRNQAEFDKHPEYLALVGGKRQGSKFCISNKDLRQLVIDNYALPYFEQNPDRDCLSMDPSDGGGWCECDECAKLGSISDRALFLANEVAAAIVKKYPDKYVGMLAYNQHSPPPTLRVHPHVIIKIQTAFIRGGYTFDQLAKGWQAQGANIGVGDYYSIFQGDMSRPASQKGSDLYRIRTSISHFKEMGARFFMAESSELSGALGLGHYLAAQLVWDVSKVDQFDALMDDFFVKAFGPARVPMEKFYRLIYRFDENDRRPLLRRDMLARMYRYLKEARELAKDDEGVMARLDDLVLFTQHEALFQKYTSTSGKKHQEAAEAVVAHAWKIRHTMMIHSKPLTFNGARRFIERDRVIKSLSEDFVWPESPYTRDEIQQMVREGVASTQTVDIGFEPVNFSDELVPATPLKLRDVTPGTYNNVAPTGRQTFYTWLDKPGQIKLRISGGHIVHYRKIASEVQTTLYAYANPMVDEVVTQDESVKPDGVEKTVTLTSPFEGLHKVEVYPPSNRAKAEIAQAGQPWTLPAGLDDRNGLVGTWSMYFYVPKGTKIVGGFAQRSRGQVLDGNDNVVFDFGKDFEAPGFFKAIVPPGQDGKLWKLQGVNAQCSLLTVPALMARDGRELLLPREVVEADSKR